MEKELLFCAGAPMRASVIEKKRREERAMLQKEFRRLLITIP